MLVKTHAHLKSGVTVYTLDLWNLLETVQQSRSFAFHGVWYAHMDYL